MCGVQGVWSAGCVMCRVCGVQGVSHLLKAVVVLHNVRMVQQRENFRLVQSQLAEEIPNGVEQEKP